MVRRLKSSNRATKRQTKQFSDFKRDSNSQKPPRTGKVQIANNKKVPNMDR